MCSDCNLILMLVAFVIFYIKKSDKCKVVRDLMLHKLLVYFYFC